MYRLSQFTRLPEELRIHELKAEGIVLDLVYSSNNKDAVLFAYNDFYVEIITRNHTDEILTVRCFRTFKRLEPYLSQVDISDLLMMN